MTRLALHDNIFPIPVLLCSVSPLIVSDFVPPDESTFQTFCFFTVYCKIASLFFFENSDSHRGEASQLFCLCIPVSDAILY